MSRPNALGWEGSASANPEGVETVQKLPLRQPVTMRLTCTELCSTQSNGTRVLQLDQVRSLRLEELGGVGGRRATRLVVLGAEGTLVLHPGRKAAASTDPPALSAAAFADRCITQILAVSPAVRLLTGLTQASYNLWIMTSVLGVAFLAFALVMVATGTPLSEMLGGGAVMAMLPACWVNLSRGKPKEVSAPELRAAVARAFTIVAE